jgi:ATP-dependent Clp protease ATP-binding subunit ClpA
MSISAPSTSSSALSGRLRRGCQCAQNLDIDLRKVRVEVELIVQVGQAGVIMGKLPQTPRAKKVIEYSIEEARNLNHNYVGTEHLLLGPPRAGGRRRPVS